MYPSIQWGGGCVSQHTMGWGCLSEGRGVYHTPPSRHPQETATDVGGTHPTGMYSDTVSMVTLMSTQIMGTETHSLRLHFLLLLLFSKTQP